MTGEPPEPPAFFTDEEGELWRRVFALPQIEPIDEVVVSLLVTSATTARGVNAAIADARAKNLVLGFDVEEWIAEGIEALDQLLESCMISRSQARRLGLLPLELADAGDDA